MDWQQKIIFPLAIGLVAEGSTEGLFHPIVQFGALSLLGALLVMNYRSANADRDARIKEAASEREARKEETRARNERERLRLETIRQMQAESMAALERAYGSRKETK